MLYNEVTFYSALTKDILGAKQEIIIYSPFVSQYRADMFCRLLSKLKDSHINVFIFTRPIHEHVPSQRYEVTSVLGQYEDLGATIHYLRGYIHEKVAIIDREILWEGSLNILSQRSSREMMRRITDKDSAEQVIRHLRLSDKLVEGQRTKRNRFAHSRSVRRSRRWFTWRTVVLCWVITAAAWWLFLAVLDIIPLNVVMRWIDILTANTPH